MRAPSRIIVPRPAQSGTPSTVKTIATSSAASVMPSTSCSITTVAVIVEIGTSCPSFCRRRRSTTIRPSSPRRAIRTVLSRKPTKIAGRTARYGAFTPGTESSALFQITPLKATLMKLASSDKITSGMLRLRKVSRMAVTSPRSTRANPIAAMTTMIVDTIARRFHEIGFGGSSSASSVIVRKSSSRSRAAAMMPGRASAVCERSSSPQPSASCSSRIAPGFRAFVERAIMTSAPGLAVSKTPALQAQVT